MERLGIPGGEVRQDGALPLIRQGVVAFCLALSLTTGVCAESGRTHFEAGNQAMALKHYPEALHEYQEGLRETPQSPVLLFNGGLAAFLCGQLSTAAELWRDYKAQYPEDWQVRSQLVQTYQQLGDRESRDRERLELLRLHSTSQDPEFQRQKQFCRDQLTLGSQLVLVFELFEPRGPKAVKYLVLVYDSAERKRATYHMSLGSYELDTRIARESGQIRSDQRIYTLDWYGSGEHRTYGTYVDEPDYDELRQTLVGALEGKLKPTSTTHESP